MHPKSGSPDRPRRHRRPILSGAVIALLLLAACGAPQKKDKGMEISGSFTDPTLLAKMSKNFAKYAVALQLFASPKPEDWDSANEQLNLLYPLAAWGDDWDLIKLARTGADPKSARRRLAVRGVVLETTIVFSQKYHAENWRRLFDRTVALGEGARLLLVTNLYKMLLNSQLDDRRPFYRGFIVELGEPALETAVELAKALAKILRAGVMARFRDMAEVTHVLLLFGDKERKSVEDLLTHGNKNVRRGAIMGIGDARELSYADRLGEILTGDPEWEVQMSAAEALAAMRLAPDKVGPILVEAMKKTRDHMVLRGIIAAIGTIRYWEAVPELMNAIDYPRYEVQETTAEALWKVTGIRIKSKAGWVRWYKEKYVSWERLRTQITEARTNPNDPKNIAFLKNLVETHTDWRIRTAAARALGRTTGEARKVAGEILAGRLRSEQVLTAQMGLLQALGSIRYPEAVPPIVEMLNPKNEELNDSALQALYNIVGIAQLRFVDKDSWRAWLRKGYESWLTEMRREP